jgi:hypothetical protein
MKKQKWVKIIPIIFTMMFTIVSIATAADNQTEFGIEDDLWVGGIEGTLADPDVEIKGFTVFGSTQDANPGGIPAGAGNVLINGYLSVSSGSYFGGISTFPAAGNIYIKDGTAGYVLRKGANNNLEWVNPATNGDNLGDHKATTALNMNNNAIIGATSITASSFTATSPMGIGAAQLKMADGIIISSAASGVNISTNVSVNGIANVTSNITIGGNAEVTGDTTITGNLTANGNTNLGSGGNDIVTINGSATPDTKFVVFQSDGLNVAWLKKKAQP